MKLIYVAGPYRAETEHGVRQNIENARQVAEYIWQQENAVPVCPHLNSAFMGGLIPDELFMAKDLEILKRCDAIMLCPGWDTSSGTIEEIRWARRLNLPVFIYNQDYDEFRMFLDMMCPVFFRYD